MHGFASDASAHFREERRMTASDATRRRGKLFYAKEKLS
jgi:hypothetical protein